MAKKIVIFLLCFFAAERLCHWQTEGFQIYKITAPVDFVWHEEPLTSSERQKIEEILDHPFRFLGSGHQSYAFESANGKVVLKFLKHTRKKRLPQLFHSCMIAYTHCKEEAGLLYAHLQARPVWNKKVEIIDKIGIRHFIDIDQTTFLLQKKAEPLCGRLDASVIDAFISHIVQRTRKGIANCDAMVERNYGLTDGHVIDIDIGSFAWLEGPIKRQIFYEILPMREYIQQNHPTLLGYFDEQTQLALR